MLKSKNQVKRSMQKLIEHRGPRQCQANDRLRNWRPTYHQPRPMIYVGEDANKYTLRPDGSLRDISPTLINLLELNLHKEMTGGDLRVPRIREVA